MSAKREASSRRSASLTLKVSGEPIAVRRWAIERYLTTAVEVEYHGGSSAREAIAFVLMHQGRQRKARGWAGVQTTKREQLLVAGCEGVVSDHLATLTRRHAASAESRHPREQRAREVRLPHASQVHEDHARVDALTSQTCAACAEPLRCEQRAVASESEAQCPERRHVGDE